MCRLRGPAVFLGVRRERRSADSVTLPASRGDPGPRRSGRPTVLSKFDDYPIHQTSQPIATPVSGDRNTYDRYWFNGYQDDGEFYFGIGAALYPNLGILDCGLSIVRDGEQHAFHASRRAPLEPTDLRIGPFEIEVLEPMRRIRVAIDENDSGISADLTFTARTACVEEGRQIRNHGRRPIMDVTRFAQFGKWEGEITYDGTHRPHRRDARLRHQGPQLGLPWRRQSGSRARTEPARFDPGLLPVGADPLGRPLHALRCVRGRQRQPLAHRRRGAPGLRVTRRHPGRRGPRPRAARRLRARARLPARHAPRRPRCASRSSTPTVVARTSTSSRSSASA